MYVFQKFKKNPKSLGDAELKLKQLSKKVSIIYFQNSQIHTLKRFQERLKKNYKCLQIFINKKSLLWKKTRQVIGQKNLLFM